MTYTSFCELNLQPGDEIWLMDKSGEGISGYYRGNLNNVDYSFIYYSFKLGNETKAFINNLQRLEKK